MAREVIRELHPVEEAVGLLLRSSFKPSTEEVPLTASLGRVAAEEVRSPGDVPPVDRSVLDGYAARWVDVAAASEESPVRLRVTARIPIDAEDPGSIGPGEAAEVATGSPLPRGADVVVPAEYAREDGGFVEVYRGFAAGYGVSARGEDLRASEVVVRRGDVVTEYHIGVLASIGVGRIKVYRRPTAVVLNTGDEVVELGKPLRPGQVYNSTGILVAAWLESRGVRVEGVRVLPDDYDVIRSEVERWVERVDFVFTTGGTSAGRRDLTVKAVRDLAEDMVHGLALTPGRPGGVALVQGRPVVMLSGMPVAAFSELVAVFDEFYRARLGRRDPWEPVVSARLRRRYTSRPGFVNVVRSLACRGGEGLAVEPLRVTGSGILSTLIKANSFFIVPADVTGYEEGELVNIRLTGQGIPECNGVARIG
ncbi:molybdopterin molybdotransferase MoeA [Stetteria hydrogenophila]